MCFGSLLNLAVHTLHMFPVKHSTYLFILFFYRRFEYSTRNYEFQVC